MSEFASIDGITLSADVQRDCDVAVIGTGAGGAMVARGLALAGAKVVMLEEGGHQTSRDFDMQEGHAYPLLYQEQGNRATADLAITVLQGRTVGGGTTVNWTTSFRTPTRTLDHWRTTYGLQEPNEATLTPHWDSAERFLGIQPALPGDVNANNRKLWDGLGKLGWQRELVRRNTRGCANSGYCGLGCPIDAKQSMLVTAIPEALAHGAELYSHVRAWTIETEGTEDPIVIAVHGQALDPKTWAPTGRGVTLHPKVCVLAGGAINSPALLLRSQLGGESKQVGKRTFLHPVVAMVAEHDEPIEGFYGAPQTVASHQFIDRGDRMGYFFETAPMQPMLAALAMNSFGAHHRAAMLKLRHTSVVIGLCADGFDPEEACGTVSLKPNGLPRLDYPFSERFVEAARQAQVDAARILLASGAKLVRSLHSQPIELHSEADLPRLAAAPVEANLLAVFTAHQMGGCAMGPEPSSSVVRPDLRHHQIENLFVVDGSVFPTSLGVNPQLSIYGLASYAVPHVLKALGRA
jgi:choline dehydrogenase-like flavoprotein